MITQYEAGATCAEIATAYDVHLSTVWKLLKKAGVERRRGDPPINFGPDHPGWKGGTRITIRGYREVWLGPDDPLAAMRRKRGNMVAEHRLVMARHLGRPLTRYESVHHIDGDKLNNNIDNLQLRSRYHGVGIKLECHDCGSHDIRPREL